MSLESSVFVPEPQAAALVGRYGISYPEHGLAENAQMAADLASGIGFPVVLKIVSPDVVHKSDAGGVKTWVADPARVPAAYNHLVQQVKKAVPHARIHGVLVCRQAEEGLETIIGAVQDPVFGPTVMAGLGGIFAEVFHDAAFRIAPVKKIDALEMIRELKGAPLFKAARGRPARDQAAFCNAILSVSRLIMENPDIIELDLNPVRLYENGLEALDVRLIKTG